MYQFPRLLLQFMLLTLFSTGAYAGIATTKHNLSATGTGNIKASGEQEICIFCHTPHNSAPAVTTAPSHSAVCSAEAATS